MIEGPPPPLIFTSIAQSVLVVVMLILTIRYLIIASRLDTASVQLACRYKRDQLKYLAILSVAIGLWGTVWETSRVLINMALVGGEWDWAMGPLAEALYPFALGLLVCILGLICMIAIVTRSSRLITRQDN